MPIQHPCGCVCQCDANNVVTTLQECQQRVRALDAELLTARNSSDYTENQIAQLMAHREMAQDALDAAYRDIVGTFTAAPGKLDEDDEAEMTDRSDEDASDDNGEEDISVSYDDISQDDEDDSGDYMPTH